MIVFLTNPGISRSWQRLINGDSGVVSLAGHGDQFKQQQCQVAGLVPRGSKVDGAWDSREWLTGDVSSPSCVLL